jgi:hypothetical protein
MTTIGTAVRETIAVLDKVADTRCNFLAMARQVAEKIAQWFSLVHIACKRHHSSPAHYKVEPRLQDRSLLTSDFQVSWNNLHFYWFNSMSRQWSKTQWFMYLRRKKRNFITKK